MTNTSSNWFTSLHACLVWRDLYLGWDNMRYRFHYSQWQDDENVINHRDKFSMSEESYLHSHMYSHISSCSSKSPASLLSSLFLESINLCWCSSSFCSCPFLTSFRVISPCSFLSSTSRRLNFDANWNHKKPVIILFSKTGYKTVLKGCCKSHSHWHLADEVPF